MAISRNGPRESGHPVDPVFQFVEAHQICLCREPGMVLASGRRLNGTAGV